MAYTSFREELAGSVNCAKSKSERLTLAEINSSDRVKAYPKAEAGRHEDMIAGGRKQNRGKKCAAKEESSFAAAATDSYEHFNKPQRMLIESLDKTNQPFRFVPENVKDSLGIAGVIIMILSVLTTALILMYK